MLFKDYYKILGLPNNKVDKNQIKAAYREQAKKYHPDVNNSRNEERFKDINEAYRVLSDTLSKRKYDRIWYRNIGRNNASYKESRRKKGSVSSEFMNIFFGDVENNTNIHNSKKIQNGENIETGITISIEEGYRGIERSIGIKGQDGKVKKIKIKIPSGIQNDEKIRVAGLGKPGKNGGKNGDLIVQIKIENSKNYSLRGQDLISSLYLSPWEAALSAKVNLNFIDEEVSIYVPAGIQTGEIIKLEGKGYKNRGGNRGDLLLETKIMVPQNMSNEEKDLFEKLNELSKYNPRGERV